MVEGLLTQNEGDDVGPIASKSEKKTGQTQYGVIGSECASEATDHFK